ncbi:hypothetical protein HN011_000921 [Eciton burchellii]|nr:hypothetical protein HN011_000921 [Eciton burchellii]
MQSPRDIAHLFPSRCSTAVSGQRRNPGKKERLHARANRSSIFRGRCVNKMDIRDQGYQGGESISETCIKKNDAYLKVMRNDGGFRIE